MERVGICELRRNLTAWLRRVRDGETFEVTNRGTPVALLVPLPREIDHVALMERRSQIVRPADGTPFRNPSLRTSLSSGEILTDLREDKM